MVPRIEEPNVDDLRRVAERQAAIFLLRSYQSNPVVASSLLSRVLGSWAIVGLRIHPGTLSKSKHTVVG